MGYAGIVDVLMCVVRRYTASRHVCQVQKVHSGLAMVRIHIISERFYGVVVVLIIIMLLLGSLGTKAMRVFYFMVVY